MIRTGVEWATIVGDNVQTYAIFGGMIVAALIIGATPFGRPLKWAETFYHEFSHGMACMLTFGRVAKLELKFDGSGCCWTRGGSRIIILLSGYIGAAVWGGLLYFIGWKLTQSADSSSAALWLQVELGIMAITLLLWVRDIQTLLIMLIMAAVYVGVLFIKQVEFLPYILQFLGLYVLLNAIRAPLHLFDGKHVGDGAALQDIFKIIPEFVWVLLWFFFALFILTLCAAYTLPGARSLLPF